MEHNRIIPFWNLLFFNRILNSEIISSTILFNNGSKFQNLSEPVVINLSSVKEVRVILNYLSGWVLPLYFLNLQYRVVFIWVSKSNWFYINYATRLAWKNSHHFFFHPIRSKPHSHEFSRAPRQVPEITASFDWCIVLLVSFVIG